MGQKVNPIGLRTALTKDWDSRWFANGATFGKWLHEDLAIRKFIKEYKNSDAHIDYTQAAIARIARPGMVIGKKGAELEELRAKLAPLTESKDIFIDVAEIKCPEVNAQLVAEDIARQLERRVGFRRLMKRAIQVAMEKGVDGIKINCAGRLGGAELARTEQYKEGRVPLHTLQTNIDYGFTEANTTAGKIGVKVWI